MLLNRSNVSMNCVGVSMIFMVKCLYSVFSLVRAWKVVAAVSLGSSSVFIKGEKIGNSEVCFFYIVVRE